VSVGLVSGAIGSNGLLPTPGTDRADDLYLISQTLSKRHIREYVIQLGRRQDVGIRRQAKNGPGGNVFSLAVRILCNDLEGRIIRDAFDRSARWGEDDRLQVIRLTATGREKGQ